MRILIITDTIPYPMISGDRIREYNLLRRMAAQHEVWLAVLQDPEDAGEGLEHLRQVCRGVEAVRVQRRHPLAHVPGLVSYAVRGIPLELKFQHSADLVQRVRRLSSEIPFDVVQIVHSHMAPYVEALSPDGRRKQVLVLQNVAFDQLQRIVPLEQEPVAHFRTWLYARMMRRWEPRYAGRFDCCVAVSEADRRLLLGANPRLRVEIVPNGVDTRELQPLPIEEGKPALLFIGTMRYTPCADAAQYLCDEILPRIRQRVGEVEVWLVGREPPPEVLRLASAQVHVTGRVPDVTPYYRQSAVCVAPLRAGGGTRLKILEAMALGRPVVSTSIGCEGLEVVDGEHLLVADDPEAFAERTAQLLTDRALYRRLVAHARRLVEQRYDWEAIAGRLMRLYAQISEQPAQQFAASGGAR